jgi:hypothetical protein
MSPANLAVLPALPVVVRSTGSTSTGTGTSTGTSAS